MTNRGRTSRKRKQKLLWTKQTIPYYEYCDILKWMKTMGFSTKCNKLIPSGFSDTGRGLMTKSIISPGEVFIDVPESLFIVPSIVRATLNLDKSTLSDIELLTVFITFEYLLGAKSKWCIYLKTLPQSQNIFGDNTALWVPDEFLNDIQTEAAKLKSAFQKCQALEKNLQMKYPNLKMDLPVFQWAWFCVNSRCVSLKVSKERNSTKDNIALIPFLDLLNHSPCAKVSAKYDNLSKSFKIISLSTIKKYDQVFINYGELNNRQLLLHYGFIVSNNPNNVVPFSNDDIRSVFKQSKNLCHPICFNKMLEFLTSKGLLKYCECNSQGLSWSLNVVLKFLCRSFCLRGDAAITLKFSEILQTIIQEPNENPCLKTFNLSQQLLDNKILFYQQNTAKPEMSHWQIVSDLLNEERIMLAQARKKLVKD